MNCILTVNSKEAYAEFVLPPINNADYELTLSGITFWTENDVTLNMEIIDGKWHLLDGKDYNVNVGDKGGRCFLHDPKAELKTDETLTIITQDRKELTAHFVMRDILYPYHKYDISARADLTVGTGEDADIRVPADAGTGPDGTGPSRKLVISRRGTHSYVEDAAGTGAYLGEHRIRHVQELSYGDCIYFEGVRLIWLGGLLAVNTEQAGAVTAEDLPEVREKGSVGRVREHAFHDSRDESEFFHRSPREAWALETDEVVIESPPSLEKAPQQSILQILGSSLLMALPMALGCLLALEATRRTGSKPGLMLYSGLVLALSSAMVGMIWGINNYRNAKKKERDFRHKRFEAYSDYLIRCTEKIRGQYEHNVNTLREQYPDTAVLLGYGRGTKDLWSRNPSQSDFLKVRIGIGDQPYEGEITIDPKKFSLDKDVLKEKPEQIRENYKTMYDVPIRLDLLGHRVIGVVGGDDKYGAYQAARVISVGIAAAHCCTDVKMAYLYRNEDSDDHGQFEYARWFPHTWSEGHKFRYVASNAQEASDVCYELTRIFRERAEMTAEERAGKGLSPHYVLFLSDFSLIKDEMISRYIFETPEKVGLTTIILAQRFEDLPNACSYILRNDEIDTAMVDLSDVTGESVKVRYDTADTKDTENFARRLSGIRVKETGAGGEIPGSVTFFEMYGVRRPEELRSEERWLKNRTYENIRGLLGEKAGGTAFYMDVHEKYHGPHGLVAGTTGSGKSETLQTYLLSLCVNYSPDDIGLFIIDFKGGGMSGLFDGLPHLMGTISNLSGNQVNRAMVSIKSENARRQQIFSEYGVNNINNYTRLYKSGEAKTPIPHLFIVVDEFAELKREQPDFMKQLISVAQVGRSLGVHLILSTQKPSGTVDDNIWSNSRFRICLRVQTKEDSHDMLGKPDAAYITQAGRAFLQVGSDEVYEQFQSGYSGALYCEGPEAMEKDIVYLVTDTGRNELSAGKKKHASTGHDETEMDAVIRYLADLSQEKGYRQNHPIWMPLLRDHIYLEELPEYAATAADENGYRPAPQQWSLEAIIGQTDDPRHQQQETLSISFSEGGNHLIIGSIVTGKSTLLQTILYSLVNRYTPEYVNIYALDFSSRALSCFEGLAHVGGVMYEDNLEKIGKFFNMLAKMLEERKKLFRGGNYSQYARANGVCLPSIIVVIDNYASFKEKTAEIYTDFLIRLSKEGVANGIFLLIAAGGVSMNEVPARIAENFKNVLCLELPDKFAYSDYLHTMHIELLPESGVKGRGLVLKDSNVLEYQTALALEAADDYERLQRIEKRCEELNSFWKGLPARHIPEIPENPTLEIFRKGVSETPESLEPDAFPIGYRTDNAEIYSLDLTRTYCYLVAGAHRTGKTNFLRLMIRIALDKGASVVIIDYEKELGTAFLASLEGEKASVLGNFEEVHDYLENSLTPVFVARNQKKHELEAEGLEPEEIAHVMNWEGEIFVFIADLAQFITSVYTQSTDAGPFLTNIFEKGMSHGIYFAGALSMEDKGIPAGYPAYTQFTSRRTGIHFGGNVNGNSLLRFDYLSFQEQEKMKKPGIGMLPETDGDHGPGEIIVPVVNAVRRNTEVDR